MEYTWEALGIRAIDRLGDAALNFGTAYGNQWLANQQYEAQLDAYMRLAQAQRPAATGLPPLVLILVGAVVVMLAARK